MEHRKRLADILQLNSERETLERAWQQTEAAAELAPLPAGKYVCRVLKGELFKAKKGTPGYKLTFEITEGEYTDRRIWHDLWLTPQALPMSKRDLAKLGVTKLEQLDQPLPPGILAKVNLALRKGDEDKEHNRVRSFEVIGIEPGDAFAPSEDPEADTSFDPEELECKTRCAEPPEASPNECQTSIPAVETNGSYRGERRG